jgi:hypothetical protein
MGSIMDRRLRRAPDADWVLMYRLGLSRKRIAALVSVPPAAVGYHLVIARRQDPGLEAEHQAAGGAVPVPYPSPGDLARMEEVIAWVSAEGRLPDGRSGDRGERSMARWLSGRRREAAEGTLDRPTAPALPRCRGGSKTAGKWKMRRGGTSGWPSSWTSGWKATTGHATTTMTQNVNMPSGSGFTRSGTNAAAANSTL